MNNTKTIYAKLLEAKKQFTAITKDQKNPHFKSAYYDINDLHKMVDPILHEQGLIVMSPIVDGTMTTKIIDVETGECLESSFNIEYNPNPQKVGSEITYYRRYLLSSFLGLQAEDDDGNKASTKKPAEKPAIKDFPAVISKMISEDLALEAVKAKNAIKPTQLNIMQTIEKVKGMKLPRPEKREGGLIVPVLEDICNVLVHGMKADEAKEIFKLDDKQIEFINKVNK